MIFSRSRHIGPILLLALGSLLARGQSLTPELQREIDELVRKKFGPVTPARPQTVPSDAVVNIPVNALVSMPAGPFLTTIKQIVETYHQESLREFKGFRSGIPAVAANGLETWAFTPPGLIGTTCEVHASGSLAMLSCLDSRSADLKVLTRNYNQLVSDVARVLPEGSRAVSNRKPAKDEIAFQQFLVPSGSSARLSLFSETDSGGYSIRYIILPPMK